MKRACIWVAGLLLALTAQAGPGHDHGDEAPTAVAGGPQRLPDGSVSLPKAAQRQFGLRTQPVEAAALPRSTELQGRVVMDPNAGGKVQPTLAGRLEAGPRGLPSLGQAVRRGEVLAYVQPSVAAIERAGQAAQLAELRAAKTQADKRAARLQELADTVPRREIEAAQSEAASLAERIAALAGGLGNREALVAPVSGVIASAHAVAGQVVDARELLFEIVDPSRLSIEALAFEPAQAADIGAAFLVLGEQRVPIRFAGAARSLREQALPLVFRAQGAALARLAVGQPVRVVVQSRSTVQGMAVPAAALMKNPSNQTIVWVKQAPERFVPKVVTVQPLDGASVAVTTGLAAGDRVVTLGATLVNQVR
jgi:membrane fusion protein, heavy metal efflux system